MSTRLLGLPSLSSLGAGSSAWSSTAQGGWGSSTDGGFYTFKTRKGTTQIPKNGTGGGHSFLGGFLHNLGSDVKATAEGFIPGTIKAVEHPIAAAEAIGKDYKTRYWDAIQKHGFGGFLHDVYLHPLSYGLDLATVGTAGLGAASRLAKVGALGEAAQGSKLADLSRATTTELRTSRLEGAPTVKFTYSSNPAAHLRQATSVAIGKKLPDVGTIFRGKEFSNSLPFLGESFKAKRALQAASESKKAGAINAAANYIRLNKLVKNGSPMATATTAFIRRMRPADELAWHLEQGHKLPDWKVSALKNPEANRLYDAAVGSARVSMKEINSKPAQIIRSIHQAVEHMGQHEAILRGLGEDITGNRALLHHHIMRGATFNEHGQLHMPAPDSVPWQLGKQKVIGNGFAERHLEQELQNRGVKIPGGYISNNDLIAAAKAQGIDAHQVIKEMGHEYLPEAPRPAEVKHLATKEEIMHGLAHEGIYSGDFKPLYFPDVAQAAKTPREAAVYRQMRKSMLDNHQNRAVNFTLGLLSDNPHLYSNHYLGAVRAAHAADIHNALEKIALSHTGELPKGYTWLNHEKGSYDRLSQLAKEMSDHGKLTAQEAVGHLRGILEGKPMMLNGEKHGLIVPSHIVNDMLKKYGAEHNFLKNAVHKSYSLWKKTVLFSPRFVSNTFLGNSVIAAMHHAGPRAIPAIYNMLLREHRPKDLEALMGKDRMMHRGEKLMQDLLPEQAATFGQDIMGGVGYAGGAKGKFRSLMNLPFKATHGHEQMMRRGIMWKAIMDTPEWRKEYRALTKQGIGRAEAQDQAARIVAERHPGLVKEWGRQIDNVMGNYRSYSGFENKLRAVAPFYGWNRHASRSALTLATEKPGRATLANQFGIQGHDELKALHESLPTYMGTYIPVPGMRSMLPGLDHKNRQGFLDTKGFNPLATVGDTVAAVRGLVTGKPGAVDPNTLSLLNPAITSLYGAISGQNMSSGAKLHGGFVGGLAGNAAQQFGDSLPPVRLLEAMTKTGAFAEPNPNNPQNMYTPTGRVKKANIDPVTGQVKFGAGKQTMVAKNPENQLINLLGLPIKEVNRDLAKTQREKQNTQTGAYFHAPSPRKKKKGPVTYSGFFNG